MLGKKIVLALNYCIFKESTRILYFLRQKQIKIHMYKYFVN